MLLKNILPKLPRLTLLWLLVCPFSFSDMSRASSPLVISSGSDSEGSCDEFASKPTVIEIPDSPVKLVVTPPYR